MIDYSDTSLTKDQMMTGHIAKKIQFISADDSSTLYITDDNLWGNATTLSDDTSSSQDSFSIGSATISSLKMTVYNKNNSAFGSQWTFRGSKVIYSVIKKDSDGNEVPFVVFTGYVYDEPKKNTSLVSVTAYDKFYDLDVEYDDRLTFPMTCGDLVSAIASRIGLKNIDSTFNGYDINIPSTPTFPEGMTWRQLLLYVCQATGNFARIDRLGQFRMKWYSSDVQYSVDTDNIYNLSVSGNIADINEINITDTDGNASAIVDAAHSGCDDYSFSIDYNPLITPETVEDFSSSLSNVLGTRFRILDLELISSPMYEAGDRFKVTDRDGNSYTSIITSRTFCPGTHEKISCNCEDISDNESDRVAIEDAVEETTQKVSKITEWSKEIQEKVDGSKGLYLYKDETASGTIYYYHDQNTTPTYDETSGNYFFGQAESVWRFSSEVLSLSVDGGRTYPYGLDITGDAIVNSLKAKTLQAVHLSGEDINISAETETSSGTKYYTEMLTSYSSDDDRYKFKIDTYNDVSKLDDGLYSEQKIDSYVLADISGISIYNEFYDPYDDTEEQYHNVSYVSVSGIDKSMNAPAVYIKSSTQRQYVDDYGEIAEDDTVESETWFEPTYTLFTKPIHINGESICVMPGDKESYSLNGWGCHVTGSQKNIRTSIPIGKVPVGVKSVTLSNFKCQIRQNGSYLIGSASALGTPDSVSATVGAGGFINVFITQNSAMSSSTNNDAASITCTFTATFS